MAKTLYARRDVLNAKEIIAWAKDQGFRTALQPGDMHVTIAYSKVPLEWPEPIALPLTIRSKLRTEPRSVEFLGGGAVTLRFEDVDLEARWKSLCEAGADWKHDGFKPHITITYDPGNIDPAIVEPYGGRILLGPEVFEEIDDTWEQGLLEKWVPFAKIDGEKGRAFGVFSVSTHKGQEVIDGEGDAISDAILEEGAYDYVLKSRIADDEHDESNRGELIESMLFTPEKCEALQKTLRESGIEATIDIPAVVWWGGHQLTDEIVKAKVRSGEYSGFSIGGSAMRRKVS